MEVTASTLLNDLRIVGVSLPLFAYDPKEDPADDHTTVRLSEPSLLSLIRHGSPLRCLLTSPIGLQHVEAWKQLQVEVQSTADA